MEDLPRSRQHVGRALKSSLALLVAIAFSACGDSSGPSVARTLTLLTIDRTSLPASIRGLDGRTMTIGIGRLQGTDIGPSCGMSLQLTTGPVTAIEIPNCKLVADEEITFTATLTDSRFPSGPHEYRFVPP